MTYNKYRAKKTFHKDYGKFDSKGELARYEYLLLLKRAGEITSEIQRQVPYLLVVNGKLVCKFIADFVYTKQNGEQVVEDWKGYQTSESKLKHKLFFAVFGYHITLVTKPDFWV